MVKDIRMWYKISKKVTVNPSDIIDKIMSKMNLSNLRGLDPTQAQSVEQDIRNRIEGDVMNEFGLTKNPMGYLEGDDGGDESGFFNRLDQFTNNVSRFGSHLESAIRSQNLSGEYIRGIERRFPS